MFILASSVSSGDFNYRHVDWVYDNNSLDGECLAGWASINSLALLYNDNDFPVFTITAGTLAPIKTLLLLA